MNIQHVFTLTSGDSGTTLSNIREWTTKNSIDHTNITVGERITNENIPPHSIGVTLGGDGTFLEGVQNFVPHDIPFFGVNTGTLGFLARVTPSDVIDALNHANSNNTHIVNRNQVSVSTPRVDGTGINDVVVQRTPPEDPTDRKITTVHVFANDEYVGEFTGTGLAVATPTGSTGLSLSSNGPIHYPENDFTLQLTPLHTHTMGVRPVIFNGETTIRLIPEQDGATVLLDGGRTVDELDATDVVTVTGSDRPAKIIRTPVDASFFASLADKLGWSVRDVSDDGPRKYLQ